MKKYKTKLILLLTSLLSGLLLFISWPTFGFPIFLFLSLIPLFFVEDFISKNRKDFPKFSVFTYSFFGLLLWNILTTYWISYATLFGLFAPVFNAIIFAFAFQLYSFIKRVVFKEKDNFLLLPIIWISIEYIHHHWELTWPWMSLGNGFADYPALIQWYEYTGIFGGSLWVLIANYFGFKALKSITFSKSSSKKISLLVNSKKSLLINISSFALIITIPIFISLIITNNYKIEDNIPVDVIAIQPNLEPYDKEKMLSNFEILDLITSLASKETDNNTDFIICPEGTLEERIWEDGIENSESLYLLSEFLMGYDKAQWITGAFTYKLQDENEKTYASRDITGAPKPYYSAYNSAINIKKNYYYEVYHKRKLVPGVEKMPFYKYIKHVMDFAISLGNLPVGTLGVDNNQPLFSDDSNRVKVIPSICYESIYGEYIARKVRQGANLVFIITNDSWWRDTQGYKQHAAYAKLRAIETRRFIARSANTGISSFIDPMGEVIHQTKFWEVDVIKESLIPQYKLTFYVKYGDYIARISLFSSILLILIGIVYQIKQKGEVKINKRK